MIPSTVSPKQCDNGSKPLPSSGPSPKRLNWDCLRTRTKKKTLQVEKQVEFEDFDGPLVLRKGFFCRVWERMEAPSLGFPKELLDLRQLTSLYERYPSLADPLHDSLSF